MEIKRDKVQLNNPKSMLVGIELGRYAVQISYIRPGMDAPETAEQITGSEVFNIPMVLCKREGVNQWFYGRDALKHHYSQGGTLVDDILQKAIDGESVDIEGEQIEALALLTLFLKRALSVLGSAHTSGTITDIMFTCEKLGDSVVSVMNSVASGIRLGDSNIHYQSYAESIYYYLLHQPEELWRNSVLVSFYDGVKVVNYSFRRNLRTTPIVTFVEAAVPYDFPFPEIVSDDARPAAYRRLDERYCDYMKDAVNDDTYSSVFLLGDGFKDKWLDKSIGLLCHNRRLFAGNDVFSRGACYALQDKYEPTDIASGHIFLGNDKLRSNIGLNVLRRGEDSYLALLDAGVNWYDISVTYEIFLPEDFILRFIVIPLDGTGRVERELELINQLDRDPDTFRVSMKLTMSNVNTVKIHVEDMGFGELFPSTGMVWELELEV